MRVRYEIPQITQAADRGFEQVSVGAGQYRYYPTGSPWAFPSLSGIAANGSAFTSGNPPAPERTQVAFLQKRLVQPGGRRLEPPAPTG